MTFNQKKHIKQRANANAIEQNIRELLCHTPIIPDALIEKALVVETDRFLGMLEKHNVMRMIPGYEICLPSFTYGDAGRQNWQPRFVDNFKRRTWYQDIIILPWFQERLLLLSEQGNALRDLIHPIISKKIHTTQYALAIYGASLFREKPGSNDLDVIVINDESDLQIFGSQEIEVPGLSQLLPFLIQDKLDLNIVSLNALKNSQSETSMHMLCALDGALFLVGELWPSFPAYLHLFHIKMMWGRQAWTFLDEPGAFGPPKMASRAKEIQALLKHILRTTHLSLNPVDGMALEDKLLFSPGEYESTANYYSRMTLLIGNFIDLVDGCLKRSVREKIIASPLFVRAPHVDKELTLTHITPDFMQTCGISKYSMALHVSLTQTQGLSVSHISICEDNTTREPNYFTEQLTKAVNNHSDILHIHFADGLLRKDKSENFIEFSDQHAEILSRANTLVATIYELGPRMLSANRLPQNILADTTHPQRIAMMEKLRAQIKRLLSVVKGVIVHSDEQAGFIYSDPEFSEIVQRNGVKIIVMRHGIPSAPQDFFDLEKRKTMARKSREKLNIQTGQFVLIQFGFIRSNKYGIDILGLLKRNKDFVWLLAGGLRQTSHRTYQDELLRDARQHNVSEQVIITGKLSDNEITPTFAAADVAIIPYKTGSESYALATCLGNGLPVVGSSLPFVRYYRRRYGEVIYSALDDVWFEKQCQYLASHRDYLATQSQATSFPREFDAWPHVALQTKAFYEEVLR